MKQKPKPMSNYFYDMIPAEELAQLQYLPTVPEYLEQITTHARNYLIAQRPGRLYGFFFLSFKQIFMFAPFYVSFLS